MRAWGTPRMAAVAALAALLASGTSAQAQEKPLTRPHFAATLQLDHAPQPATSRPPQSLAERSLPSLLFSPGQWREALNEFSAESKAAQMHFYWTGQPMMIERNSFYYSRSSLAYTKGIILGEIGHGRLDFGLYKGRVTLEQNRIYGMGPRPVGNPILGNDIRFFRSPLLANVDKVFVMLRFHVTLPRH